MPLNIAAGGLYDSSSDTLLSSEARTASGTSNQYHAPAVGGLVVEINVTAVSGTSPTLDVDLEDSFDGVTWNKVADVNAANITAAGVTVKRLNLKDTPTTGRLRLAYTIAGTTPSFTFTAKVHASRGA